MTGRGIDVGAPGLVVEADVAADDRHARRPGTPRDMPSMASDSCHMTSGWVGLPKLRQFTTASGRAPTQARLSTDSATVSAVPWPGIDRAPARGCRRW